DLHDVEQVQRHRRTEPHLRPVPGHRPDLLRPGALAPFGVIDHWEVGTKKPHHTIRSVARIRTCSTLAALPRDVRRIRQTPRGPDWLPARGLGNGKPSHTGFGCARACR